jgi:copper chaperone CopZ
MINNIELKGAVAAQNVAEAADRQATLNAYIGHHVPGRLRLRSAALKDDARASAEARTRFGRIEGVTSVTANPVTGSLLLEYDPRVLAPARIIDALAAHGCVAAAADPPGERGGGWADRLVAAIESWIIDALAERLVIALIGALA